MNRKAIGFILAVLLTAAMCGMSVLAAGEEAPAPAQPEQTPAAAAPDPVGTVSFQNLNSRMRENNFNLLALEETIASIEAIDYEKMTDDIRDNLNQLADAQWMLIQFGQGGSYSAASLKNSYDALRNTYDDLKDGVIQDDNAAVVRQLRNAQNQIVMAGESLYVALVEMERNNGGLDRSLTALDRTVEELTLRYELGQISELTLRQASAGRTALVSGKSTLEMNITNYKAQLELMIGAAQTGEIRLQALPQVTDSQLAAMDLEADLAAAKAASYDLFAAGRTLNDAKEDFEDAKDEYSETSYQYSSAQHTWQAAQYTYDATVQSFENSFRVLFNQIKDYRQVWDAAKEALALEQENYAVAQLKYEQGTISHNALLDAADAVSEAQEKVDGAAIDLFSAYNNYCWAVQYGILN